MKNKKTRKAVIFAMVATMILGVGAFSPIFATDEEPAMDEIVVGEITEEEVIIESVDEKVTPASQDMYEFEGNFVVGKKGGEYFLWTEDQDFDKQDELMNAINEKNLSGLGKEMTESNTKYKDGYGAQFIPKKEGFITIFQDENGIVSDDIEKTYIEFSAPNIWSLFYAGFYNILKIAPPQNPEPPVIDIPEDEPVDEPIEDDTPVINIPDNEPTEETPVINDIPKEATITPVVIDDTPQTGDVFGTMYKIAMLIGTLALACIIYCLIHTILDKFRKNK